MSPALAVRRGPSDRESSTQPIRTAETADSARPADFDAIYRTWFVEVSRWARAFGGLDADVEDLCQEVFLVVRRKLPTFDGENLPGWLYRITQRTVSDYRRRAWIRRYFGQPRHYLEQVPDSASDPREVAEQRQTLAKLNRILMKLSQAKRAAFILYEVEGYSGEEIAALEGTPVKTVYSRLHYARKEFLEHLARSDDEELAE